MTISTFTGTDGLKNFLNPENHSTPLVELPPTLNPYFDDNVHIFIKMQSLLPLLNVKMLPAWQMLKDAPSGKKHLVEASSGNTALSMAILAQYFGFDDTKSYLTTSTTIGKIKMLLLFGSNVSLVNEDESNQDDPDTTINRAKNDGKKDSWYNPNQYANPSNPKSHENIAGPQIFEQLGGEVDVFAGGLGTSGTVLGVSQYLRRVKKDIKIVGIVRAKGEIVPGPREREFLDVVELDWESASDVVLAIGQQEAYKHSLRLLQAGLMAGPSTGLNYAGLLRYLERVVKDKLDDKPLNAVFMACDTTLLYIDDYFKILPREDFPTLEGEELMTEEIFAE